MLAEYIDQNRLLSKRSRELSGLAGLGVDYTKLKSSAPHYTVLMQETPEIAKLRYEIVSGTKIENGTGTYQKFKGRDDRYEISRPTEIPISDENDDTVRCPAYFFTDDYDNLYVIGRCDTDDSAMERMIQDGVFAGMSSNGLVKFAKPFEHSGGDGWYQNAAYGRGHNDNKGHGMIDYFVKLVREEERLAGGKRETPIIWRIIKPSFTFSWDGMWEITKGLVMAIGTGLLQTYGGALVNSPYMKSALNIGKKVYKGDLTTNDIIDLSEDLSGCLLGENDIVGKIVSPKTRAMIKNVTGHASELHTLFQNKDYEAIAGAVGGMTVERFGTEEQKDKAKQVYRAYKNQDYTGIAKELGLSEDYVEMLSAGFEHAEMINTFVSQPNKLLDRAKALSSSEVLAIPEINILLNSICSTVEGDTVLAIPNKIVAVKAIVKNAKLRTQEFTSLLNYGQEQISEFVPGDLVNLLIDSEEARALKDFANGKEYILKRQLSDEVREIVIDEVYERTGIRGIA